MGENTNQMNEFCYETLGFDRININTHLRIIIYRKQPSMMVRRIVTLMTYTVTYGNYGNTMLTLEFLNETLGSVIVSIIKHL